MRYKNMCFSTEEKYSRGRRGAPAKGIGRVTGARVQIPPSPFKSIWQNQSAILSGAFILFNRTVNKNFTKQRYRDRKSTRLNSSHVSISYAVFCLKKKKKK